MSFYLQYSDTRTPDLAASSMILTHSFCVMRLDMWHLHEFYYLVAVKKPIIYIVRTDETKTVNHRDLPQTDKMWENISVTLEKLVVSQSRLGAMILMGKRIACGVQTDSEYEEGVPQYSCEW